MQVGIDEEKNVSRFKAFIQMYIQARQEALDFKIKNLD